MKRFYPILLLVLLFAVKQERIEFDFKFIDSYSDYNDYYNSMLSRLEIKHSVKLFSFTGDILRPSLLKPLLNTTVIIDTTVLNSYKKNGEYFIRAQYRTAKNILCELKCDKDFYTGINKSDNRHYLVAVKINSIKSQQNVVELDSIDNKSLFVDTGQNVILYGDCLDAVELPFSMIFTND